MNSAHFKVYEKSWDPQPAEAAQTSSRMKSRKRLRSVSFIGWLPLALLPSVVIASHRLLQPWVFMWTLAVAIFLGLKWVTWWRVQELVPHPAWRSVVYLFAWPGMDAESFLDETKSPPMPRSRDWFWAIFDIVLGAILFWLLARTLPQEQPLLRGWTGMLGLILLLHFGTFQIVALFWQSLGVNASPIMSAPLRAQSLSEFWGKRWNLGFRKLAHNLIFVPASKYLPVGSATLLVFLVSGLIHDLVISVPAQAGYGLPTGYFLIQGSGVILERSKLGRHFGLGGGVRGWLFMALVAVGPVFWLFHPPFVLRVIVPFMKASHAL
jgi:hypothetical protein